MSHLFDKTEPPKPRQPRRRLMHVVDAGDGSEFGVETICVFRCRECDHTTEWTPVKSTTEAKRGIPCPKCNRNEER